MRKLCPARQHERLGASRNEVTDMGEVDDFLAAVMPLQRQADLALLNGDAGARKMLWSHKDPVTVFGAAKTVSGWPEVESLSTGWRPTSQTAPCTSWT